MTEKYDLIIVGAGPAGFMAAVYAARYKLKTIVIGEMLGGQISKAHKICNFPTYDGITGFELVQKLQEQVKNFGIEIKLGKVNGISGENGKFNVKTSKENYESKKVILALGSERQELKLPREKELTGKGISYCATCDAGFYQDKVVGVVGGSDAALTAALLLSKFAKKVSIFYRKEKFFRAEPAWVEEVEKVKNIEAIFNSEVREFLGEEKLTGVKILQDGDEKEIDLDGLFIEIGSLPDSEIAKKMGVEIDKKGYIKADKRRATNVEGVFAAGDTTDNVFKQAVTACGEGAIAAHSVYEDLEARK